MTNEQKIHDSLGNAIQNGTDFDQMSVDDIVEDLMTYDSDAESMEFLDVQLYVKSWLEKNKTI